MKKRGEASNGLPPELRGGKDFALRPGDNLDRAAELELIDAALLGDIEAFTKLFEHYRNDLCGFCFRRLYDQSLAEDAVQDVFLRAFTSFPSFDREKRVWPWLATIAYRLCTDIQRELSRTYAAGNIGVIGGSGVKGHTGSALDSVLASEEREQLMKSLQTLPKRQRRALLLFAFEGLSYEDIAAAEGISVDAVGHLLARARKKMRSIRRSGPLPAIFFPIRWLRWKAQRIEERLRPLLSTYGDSLPATCVQAVCLSTLVAMVVAVGQPTASSFEPDPSQPGEAVALSLQSPLQTEFPQTLPSAIPAKPAAKSQQSVADPPSLLAEDVINPNQNATPENASFTSIEVSPNYESDHTVMALGGCKGCVGNALFASHDGGGSWKTLPARFLFPSFDMALSPGYPRDQRIFVLGNDVGLQQSDDGGGIFKVASPLIGWSLAVSPSFGRTDSSVLIGGKTVLQYDAGLGVTQPALLPIPSARGLYSSIIYSPNYPADSTIFVADNSNDQILYACKGLVCDERRFPGPLKFRLSPGFGQDDLAYAFSFKRLLVSNDGLRTVRDLPVPLPGGSIGDVAILWSESSAPAIFAYVRTSSLSSVYRSFDEGRSWSGVSIDLPGFEWGARNLIVTPTGRLLVTGVRAGLACSEDLGETWAPRCPPE